MIQSNSASHTHITYDEGVSTLCGAEDGVTGQTYGVGGVCTACAGLSGHSVPEDRSEES